MKRIFAYESYRNYLNDKAKIQGRGFASRLAAVLRCQNSFVSQVLGGSTHFSAEHAIAVAKFLSLSENETEYLVLMVLRERAGSPDLIAYYDRMLRRMANADREVKTRLKPSAELGDHAKSIYYSSWKYQAVHVATSIPRLAKAIDIASALGITLRETSDALAQLNEWGLVTELNESYFITKRSIHLDRGSHLGQNFHLQWRMRAMSNLPSDDRTSLNFSSTVSLSKKDATKVRELLLEAIQRHDDLVDSSPEEEVWALNVDWFPVTTRDT